MYVNSYSTRLDVVADPVTGAWSASFGGLFDVTDSTTFVRAHVFDAEGDATVADFN